MTRRRVHVRLDAASREHRGGLPSVELELCEDGTPHPLVHRGRLYSFSHEERTPDGVALWAVFSDAGPLEATSAA